MSSSNKDSHLYRQRPHNLSHGKEISSSTTLAFTSQLSSLISSSATSKNPKSTTSSRSKPKKDDIFTRPNRNSAKRAKRDTEDSAHFEQKHTTDGEGLDRAIWARSKRKMEEKARLYAAMKRGDVEDEEERFAVDFERKWAENHGDEDVDDDDDDDGDDDGDGVGGMVEYTDEFGRLRQGTRAQAAQARRAEKSSAELASDRFTARPAAPANVIYGDTIQHQAFDPDAPVAVQMAELAAKRDEAATPPPDEHFDGRKEVRSKGTGFFQFAEDEEERARQMEGLEKERRETEKVRAERAKKVEERRREIEERRREIAGMRAKRKADEFLEGLGAEIGEGVVEEGEPTDGAEKEEER